MTDPLTWTVELPVPPSANRMHRSIRTPAGYRPVISREYKAWEKAAQTVIAFARRPPFAGRVAVEIVLFAPPRCGILDIDNVVKPVVDAVRKGGVIRGDSRKWVGRVTAVDGGDDGRPRVAVSITPFPKV